MQNITIAGRLGSDAKNATTQGGDAVCNFTVAVDARNGREKVTNWWRVSLWGKRGEALGRYLTKGTSVAVSGEFSLGQYDGKPQLNVRANEVALLGGGERGGGGEQRREPDGSRGAPQHQRGSFADDLDDDSIPFVTSDSAW